MYDPWIVLVAIYTVHSEKQETFWLQWTYSVLTILWEELFPAYSEAGWEHAQSRTTEVSLTIEEPQQRQLWMFNVVLKRTLMDIFS